MCWQWNKKFDNCGYAWTLLASTWGVQLKNIACSNLFKWSISFVCNYIIENSSNRYKSTCRVIQLYVIMLNMFKVFVKKEVFSSFLFTFFLCHIKCPLASVTHWKPETMQENLKNFSSWKSVNSAMLTPRNSFESSF